MASEIVYSGIGDLRVAEVIGQEYLLLIADRNALPNHPALHYVGNIAGRGSSTIKVPHIGLMGYDLLAQTGDGSLVANTALTDGSSTVAVVRYSKSYEASDLAMLTDGQGLINPQSFAMDATISHAMTLTSLIADVTDGFTTTAGSTGVDMTVANFLTALGYLEVNSQGAIAAGAAMAILHPQQLADLRQSFASSSGGSVQWSQEANAQLAIRGNGYRGQIFGVDVFSSSKVPTANAGADRAGGMFVKGGVLWADGSVPVSYGEQVSIGGKLLFERDRTAKAGTTAFVTHGYLGVTKGLDLLGVSIITDA